MEEAPREGAYSWSTTYVVPGFTPPDDWPTAREPELRVRVVPNESLLPGPLGHQLGELVQRLVDEGAEHGISVELDTSDRTRPGELRGGASPVEGLALFVAYVVARQLERLLDRLFDAAVEWALAHRQQDGGDPIIVSLYGPDGEVVKTVEVPQDGSSPRSR